MPGLYSKYIKLIHLTGDLTVITLSSVSAYVLTKDLAEDNFGSFFISFITLSVLSWLICTTFLKFYKYKRVISTLQMIGGALRATFLYILLIEATINITNITSFSRLFLIYHYILFTGLLLIWRLLLLESIKLYRRSGYNYKVVIIAGYGKPGIELESFFDKHPEHGYRLLGYFDDHIADPKVLGKISEIEKFVLENEVDEIYCCPFELTKEQLIQLKDFVDNNLVRMKYLPEPGTLEYNKLRVDFYDMQPVLILRTIPLDDVVNKTIKRSFDIVFSAFMILFVLSWLIPLLALIIKLESRGPVFFKQERSGINNHTFRCWKLRTMYVNDEANTLQARPGDPRITPFGAILRKTSLDEFPQFFNVLLGNMSVVGPRPHMLKHTQEYATTINKFMVRHFIKPGITGLSQVRGFRGDTSQMYQMKGRVKLDIFYLENWTFLLDLKIIYYTVYNMFFGDKNAF